MEKAKKCVILHPLSRGKDVEEMTIWKETEQEAAVLRRSKYLTLTALRERERQPDGVNFRRQKNFLKKNFRKSLVVSKKAPNFANAFDNERKPQKKEIVLWKTLDKQTKM